MASRGEYEGDKYRCNHPESDFVNNSKGPIELKREKYVEYTHRNEIANYQYDVWSQENAAARRNSWYDGSNTSTNSYGSNYKESGLSSSRYQNKKKKNSSMGLWIFLALWFGLPLLISFLTAIFSIFAEL